MEGDALDGCPICSKADLRHLRVAAILSLYRLRKQGDENEKTCPYVFFVGSNRASS